MSASPAHGNRGALTPSYRRWKVGVPMRRSPGVPFVRSGEAGQSTAEYALVMIAAAAVAGLLLAWAHKTNLVSGLFNSVIEKVLPF